jgi:hypothetical protein
MGMYVKDPVAFIRNFEFSKQAETPDEHLIKRWLNIKVYHADMEDNVAALMQARNYYTVSLGDSYALAAEVVADYFQDNKFVLGIMPYARVSKYNGAPGIEEVYLDIVITADVNYGRLLVSLQALIDRTVGILVSTNTTVVTTL